MRTRLVYDILRYRRRWTSNLYTLWNIERLFNYSFPTDIDNLRNIWKMYLQGGSFSKEVYFEDYRSLDSTRIWSFADTMSFGINASKSSRMLISDLLFSFKVSNKVAMCLLSHRRLWCSKHIVEGNKEFPSLLVSRCSFQNALLTNLLRVRLRVIGVYIYIYIVSLEKTGYNVCKSGPRFFFFLRKNL